MIKSPGNPGNGKAEPGNPQGKLNCLDNHKWGVLESGRDPGSIKLKAEGENGFSTRRNDQGPAQIAEDMTEQTNKIRRDVSSQKKMRKSPLEKTLKEMKSLAGTVEGS